MKLPKCLQYVLSPMCSCKLCLNSHVISNFTCRLLLRTNSLCFTKMNKKTAQGLPDFLEEIGRGIYIYSIYMIHEKQSHSDQKNPTSKAVVKDISS